MLYAIAQFVQLEMFDCYIENIYRILHKYLIWRNRFATMECVYSVSDHNIGPLPTFIILRPISATCFQINKGRVDKLRSFF